MAKAISFSTGVDRFVDLIRPHGRPGSAFPTGLAVKDAQRRSNETLQEWFVRLVDRCCGGAPRRMGLEDNLAVFANFRWDRDKLVYASMPTLVVEGCDLDQFYRGEEAEAVCYLRLDLDYHSIGHPFSHPLPHLHVSDDRCLRFALDGGTSGNVVLDFLEFVYRNHFPDKWLDWARRQWLGAQDGHEEPFDKVVQAFQDNQFGVLKAYASEIRQIKRRLREAKDSLFAAHMEGADREIVEYPCPR